MQGIDLLEDLIEGQSYLSDTITHSLFSLIQFTWLDCFLNIIKVLFNSFVNLIQIHHISMTGNGQYIFN